MCKSWLRLSADSTSGTFRTAHERILALFTVIPWRLSDEFNESARKSSVKVLDRIKKVPQELSNNKRNGSVEGPDKVNISAWMMLRRNGLK